MGGSLTPGHTTGKWQSHVLTRPSVLPTPEQHPLRPRPPPLALRAHRERRRSKEGREKRKGKEKGQEQGEHSRLKEEKQHITRCCKGTWRSDSEKSPGVCEGAGAPMSVTPTGLPAQGR